MFKAKKGKPMQLSGLLIVQNIGWARAPVPPPLFLGACNAQHNNVRGQKKPPNISFGF